MIKVLERVELKENQLTEQQCKLCTSALEINVDADTVLVYDKRDGVAREFTCPVCNAKQYLTAGI